MIILPAIDLRQGRCVRLRQGRADAETIYDDDPAGVARRWVAQGAGWLHVVDLDAALASPPPARLRKSGPGSSSHLSEAKPPGSAADGEGPKTSEVFGDNLQRLAEIHAAVPETPIQFGGGLRTLEAIETALALGASRVVLGTVAVHQPDLVAEALRRFGPERIVAGIDARQGWVATHGWQQTSRVTAVDLGRAMRQMGVLRAVYTDVSRDGMLAGANVEATAALARSTGLAVIASGGVASLEDVARLRARAGDGIEGVIAGQALYRGTLSLPEAIRLAQGSL
jgi:phosphoribosylformimino-5-aminoimidazole carboxamide ribotide isomerase